MRKLLSSISLFLCIHATLADVRSFTLNVGNRQLAPDGFNRNVIVANGVYPNPPILVNKGDTLRVTVNNRLTDTTMRRSTALNLDGIFFNSQNVFMEGEPFVNACPISPGRSFTYQVPLGSQTGTHWYHSALGVQYADGFRGPLIIYDQNDPQRGLYDVDDINTIIQLGDWYHGTSSALADGYAATGTVPISDAGTVNGRGRFNGGPAVPWSVITVARGKRYRFRIINESVRDVFTISIDSHTLTIIEADGIATQTITYNKIEVHPGQRYSVVVTTSQQIGNYWFNAPFVGGNAAGNPNQNATLSRAIFRYIGAPIADPTTPMTSGPTDGALNEADLRPLFPTQVSEPDVMLNISFAPVAGRAEWRVLGNQYLSPEVPTLNRVIDGATGSSDFDLTENTFILPQNRVVEIRFPAGGAHPFHLHGMPFQVIKPGGATELNTVNPISRDTISVGGANGVIIRFVTAETGPWMFHCHIYWHKNAGLATVMLVDPAAARANVRPNAAWEALCPLYDALPEDQK